MRALRELLWRLRGTVPTLLQLIYLGNGEVLRYSPDEADLRATERKLEAIWAAIQRATRLRESATVWLIHSVPKPDQLAEYERMRWEVIVVDPGREVVEARVREQRPGAMLEPVARWYAQQTDEATGLVAPSRKW